MPCALGNVSCARRSAAGRAPAFYAAEPHFGAALALEVSFVPIPILSGIDFRAAW